MTPDVIKEFLGSIYRLHHISIRLYSHGKIAAIFGTKPADPDVAATEDSLIHSALISAGASARLLDFESDILLAAIIPCPDGMQIALGPVRTNILRDEYVRRMLDYIANSRPGMANAVYEYLKILPVLSRNQLADIADVISMATNSAPSGLSADIPPETPPENTSAAYLTDPYIQNSEIPRIFEEERRILFMVKNGLTHRIKPILASNIPIKGSLRTARNDFLTLAALASRAAISSGADPAQCLQMASAYADRIELCADYAEAAVLREKMLLEYARLAASTVIRDFSNPLIRRAVRFVSENITQKISCSDVARALGVSRTYLSTCFSRETGLPLAEYINRRKVTAAKELLLFTDMPISAVAQQLAFSSQAYFQNVFKKITSKTPAECRLAASEEDFV